MKEGHGLEHSDSPECLGAVLQSMIHIFQHGLLPYRFFNLPLSFDVERVSLESGNLSLAFEFGIGLHLPKLAKQFVEPGRVRLCSLCEFRLSL